MKKNTVIIIAIIVVALLVAGGAALALLNSKPTSSTKTASNASTPNATTTTESASIDDLLSRNASLECTYNVVDGESTNTGVAYFSGAKDMYGEFTNKTSTSQTTAHVIRQGDTQYVWLAGSTDGYKANVAAYDPQKQAQMSQQFDPSKKYQFQCKNWTKDSSKFVPPTNVTFRDISTQLEQAGGASKTAREQACNAISNPSAKAACLSAIR